MTPLSRPAPGSAPTPSRRDLLAVALATSALGGAAFAAPGRAASSSRARPLGPLSVRGGDLSFLLQEEAVGNRFSDAGRIRPVERILAGRGATWVRLRVWTNPPTGYSTLDSALTLARRAKKAGLKILVDPHYSDFWADPQRQPIPAGWPTDLTALAEKVHSYTRDVVRAFSRQGTPVDMIQIGNEVTNGILWPVGELYRFDGTNWTSHWPEFTTLIKAGIAGALEGASKDHRPRLMMHVDKGGDNGVCRYFYDQLSSYGIDIDVIGLSYYPMWHGSLTDLATNLNDLATRYDKDIVVVETQYPWTITNGDGQDNFVRSGTPLPDGALYPATPEGQAGYYEALRSVLTAVPNGRGAGFMVWEPEWIPGVGWEPGAGTPNDNMTLFDFTGKGLPALKAFRPPRR